ncbi:hypothetical protein D7322_13920 [Sphingobacterium puteale]|uniref:Histone deacetylase n=1 Tax=Sphingobacterium puteale TaxID=2420510 RepID=A0A420VXZ6_9SPHI|nr:hypothetical protein [Sphingobacterium puteale]RKO71241.1 hypothetical protein D7322_13920 [Sphingobacterium puteale]
MDNLNKKVWYACYGSNLLQERFLCYIKGGQPAGANTSYDGCDDKTLPINSEQMYIPAELYFAKVSKNWNGGIAFIRTTFTPTASTYGRIYLITKGQLIDIARQETNTSTSLEIEFGKVIKNGSYIFKQPSWYGNILYLGEHNGFPIFTITNEQDSQSSTKPSIAYLKTIIDGLRESHGLDNLAIFDYLKTKHGIIENYSEEALKSIISENED